MPSAVSSAQAEVFQFPLDLGGTPNQGHFILFYVNTQDVGKLKYMMKKKKNNNNMKY